MARARSQNSVKSFLSSRQDTFRPPYGRGTITVPRSCIIVGSTNDDHFLSDVTGNRRYWTVTVSGTLDIERLREWRDQLWGEAVAAFQAGETWWFDDESALDEEREQHFDEDPWDHPIRLYVKDKTDVTVYDVLSNAFRRKGDGITGAPPDMLSLHKSHQMRVANCLKRQGWVKSGRGSKQWKRGNSRQVHLKSV